MIPADLTYIANIVQGKLKATTNRRISSISIDSRTVVPSADVLFFCIRGERHNGHNYIPALIKKGIKNFVVDEKYTTLHENVNFIVVQNTLEALQQLTAQRRADFPHPVIGITGSNGKTIVKEWLAQCLQLKYKIVRSPKSYNSQVGVPLSVWLLDHSSDLAIFEAGISYPREMEKIERIIRPDIGIITNIGEPHQENFTTLKEKAIEKIKLFQSCKTIVYCKDYQLLDQLITEKYPQKNLVTWSLKNKSAAIQVTGVKKDQGFSEITFRHNQIVDSIRFPFVDAASVENVLHVLAVLLHLKFDITDIHKAIQHLSPVAMRLEQKQGINNCVIINDTYNSDLNSLTIALDYLAQQPDNLNKSVILSDILQSGRPEQELYKEVALLISNRKINRFIGIGRKLWEHRHLFNEGAQFFTSTPAFQEGFLLQQFQNEAILIKGARSFQFEQISAMVEEKLHKTVFEINLDALVHNLNFYRSLIPSGTKMMVMLKAFSYGSGTYEVASELQHQQVDYIGVAIADEGVFLRKHGIYTPIMVMNPDEGSFQLLTDYQLEPEIYSFEMLARFQEHVKRNGLAGYPVHLKIDSGMHRLGFLPGQVDNLINYLKNQHGLLVKSVFSHLAASDEPQNDAFTRNQVNLYLQACDNIKNALGYPFIRHILNTAGIERFPEAAFDMVRLGIGLYGSSVHRQKELETVGRLKSTIIQTKEIPANETIGYSRKGKFNEPKIIGILPVGYADGLNRLLSNGKGYAMVRGKKASIVGNVCMDMTMIDITGLHAQINDEVIIFGEKPTINEIATSIDTIPYEVLTGVSQRVKRVYYRS